MKGKMATNMFSTHSYYLSTVLPVGGKGMLSFWADQQHPQKGKRHTVHSAADAAFH
jgi:hypothetical protein